MKRIIKIFIRKNKKFIFLFLLLFLVTIFIVFNKNEKVYASNDLEEINILDDNIVDEVVEIKEVEENIKTETLFVDIKGEVINPGVYELEVGKRIIDVVNLSGGLTKKAVTKNVNLSKKLYDEMVIIIPDSETTCEVIPIYNTNENTNENIDSGLVNINTCSLEELLTLTGVGESKAKAIIEYRKTNKFESIEDIMNITGIKESLFNKIKDEITV